MVDEDGETVLHYVARSRKPESAVTILQSLPESQRWQLVSLQDEQGNTALHYAAYSNCHEWIVSVLALLPESQRKLAVTIQNGQGKTVLQCVNLTDTGLESIMAWLPRSENAGALEQVEDVQIDGRR